MARRIKSWQILNMNLKIQQASQCLLLCVVCVVLCCVFCVVCCVCCIVCEVAASAVRVKARVAV